MRIEEMLREIRELSLLGDTDRGDRLAHRLDQRKRLMSRKITELVDQHEFARAETDPDGSGVAIHRRRTCRRMPARSRSRPARKRRQDRSPGLGADRASGRDRLVGSGVVGHQPVGREFSGESRRPRLLSRVAHEHDVFIDTNAQALYAELRRHIEQHQWRGGQQCRPEVTFEVSDASRTQQMRRRLRTIQENADIQERQEAEVQIQELIRAGQFRDAIDLAEEIIRRFPGSPQAEAIEAMLPPLQDLAGEPQEPVL